MQGNGKEKDRKGLLEVMTFEQMLNKVRNEVWDIWRKNFPGKGVASAKALRSAHAWCI